ALLGRSAAGGDVPPRARRAEVRRAGRGAPSVGSAADPGRLQGAGGDVAARARAHAARGGAAQVRGAAGGGYDGRLEQKGNQALRPPHVIDVRLAKVLS